MSSVIKLVVVDDHDMFREMLVRLLSTQEGFEVVGAVGTIAEASESVERLQPDVVLLDISMPDGSGIEWARTLKSDHPETGIVFLTASDGDEVVIRAINTGAEGYVLKNSKSERLLDAIRAVASREYLFYPVNTLPILQRVARVRQGAEGSENLQISGRLSRREREVASLVMQGLTYREIAETTAVSVNTVKTHVRRIYQRLGVSSRRELKQSQITTRQETLVVDDMNHPV